jgi:hypothetical protein
LGDDNQATDAGAEASAGDGAASESGSANYEQRLFNGGQFAVDQNKAYQSTADKALAGKKSAEDETTKLVESMGQSKELIEQFGGDIVAQAVRNYINLRSSDELGKTIQSFETTGQLSKQRGNEQGADEDEYQTPEEIKIKALEARCDALSQGQSDRDVSVGRQQLKEHMATVFGELGLTEADKDSMESKTVKQFETWGASDVGRSAIKSMEGPGGLDTVRGMMYTHLSPDALRAAASNVDLQRQQGLDALATDGRPATYSRGTEAPPSFDGDYGAMVKWARQNPQGHDSR